MPNEIVVDGWFYQTQDSKADTYPELGRAILNDKVFKRTIRRLNMQNLIVTDIERIIGNFFSPIYVVGVVDLSGSAVPFFITRDRASKLEIETRKLKRNIL